MRCLILAVIVAALSMSTVLVSGRADAAPALATQAAALGSAVSAEQRADTAQAGITVYVGPRRRYYRRHYYYRPYYYRRRYYRPYYHRKRYYGRCGHWRKRCAANWGYGNSSYYGCLRYHGCR